MTRITTVAFLAALVAASGCSSKKTTKAADVAAPTKTASADKAPDTAPAKDTAPANAPGASLNDPIYFEFDQAALSADARAKLDQNAEWLREDAARKLTIEGHTDEVGTPEYNLGLGERRARAAQEYLVRLGIDASRIQIITYGEERPASADDAQNRRSMFIATQKPVEKAAK
jgi:peptidoglycan-associated lipoprotein